MTETGAPRPVTTSEHVARFGPADRDASVYVVVPFDVPARTRAIRVSLAYDHPAPSADPGDGTVPEGNVIDLGLLGPGPTEAGRADFRGWSGSERATVVVADSAATPGYRPGPIRAGTWHVLLGLYRIAPSGCTAQVVAETFRSVPSVPGRLAWHPPRPARRDGDVRGRRPPTLRWHAVDLHAHTEHSDGADTIDALARRARAAGLEALFVTDHNTDAHLPHLELASLVSGLVLLPGEEVTTYGGHFNALGIRRWVEFRHTGASGIAGTLATIHDQGAIASLNHPTSAGIPWLHGTDLDIDGIEVWNGPWSTEDDRAIEAWDALLDAGRRIVALGGSDTHGPGPGEQPVGTPTTWVRTGATDLASILASIRDGRVALTRDPHTPPPDLEVVLGDQRWRIGEPVPRGPRDDDMVVRWRWPDGVRTIGPAAVDSMIHVIADGRSRHVARLPQDGAGDWRLPRGSDVQRIRLEVRGPGGELVALTNHVFLREATA